jgi:tripartite-type tricarboxylate transporter receptor subunit TctC
MKAIATLFLTLGVCTSAAAQGFPDKPVTLVVPFAAGGPTDVVARHLAVSMGKSLGQQVLVENRSPSAGGIIGTEAVLRAEPNGYTLLIHNIGMATLPSLSRSLKFNPAKDFDYVGQVADVPMTLVGKRDLAPSSFRDLQRYVATNGKGVNLAHAGIGTASHLCGLLLMSRLKVLMTTVPYKGAAPAMTDLQGGHVDLLCDQITTTLQPIQTQRVKAYGSTAKDRLPTLPELPTLGEQGLSDFEVTVWHGVYAPKNLPKPVLDRLVKALQDGVADPSFRDSMQKLGALPVSKDKASPEGLANHLRNETAKWSPVIKAAEAFID